MGLLPSFAIPAFAEMTLGAILANPLEYAGNYSKDQAS
jgi:hypothetical protein